MRLGPEWRTRTGPRRRARRQGPMGSAGSRVRSRSRCRVRGPAGKRGPTATATATATAAPHPARGRAWSRIPRRPWGRGLRKVRREPRRGLHQRQCQQRARALAHRHPVVEERFEGHPVQRLRLRRLPAVLPGQPPVGGAERDPLSDQRARGRHDAVEDDRHLPRRALQQEPGHRRQVGTAHGREQLELVAEHRPGAPQRVPYGGALAHPRQVVDGLAAPAGHDRRVRSAQRRDQHGRRRGPADADVAEHHQVRTGVRLLVREGDPGTEGGLGLLQGHRVLDVDPARTAADPVPHDLGGQPLGVALQCHVDHPHRHAEPTGQHRGGARALQDRPDQRGGSARGACRHAQGGDPVVTREQHDTRMLDRPHRHRGLRRRQPLTQVVEAAQGAGRDDLSLPPRLGVTAYASVGALDQIGEVVEIKRAHSPNSTGLDRTRPRHVVALRIALTYVPFVSDCRTARPRQERPCPPPRCRPPNAGPPMPPNSPRAPSGSTNRGAPTAPGAARGGCAPGCGRPTCGSASRDVRRRRVRGLRPRLPESPAHRRGARLLPPGRPGGGT